MRFEIEINNDNYYIYSFIAIINEHCGFDSYNDITIIILASKF